MLGASSTPTLLVIILSTPFHKYDNVCGRVLRDEVEERGGVDAFASSMTNDKEIVRNPLPPEGLGRDGPNLVVTPPRRWQRIDSSSCLDLGAVALPTNIIVFMVVSIKVYDGHRVRLFQYGGLLQHVRAPEHRSQKDHRLGDLRVPNLRLDEARSSPHRYNKTYLHFVEI